MDIQPIYLDELATRPCNSTNHHEYSPFIVSPSTLTIDPSWWQQLLDITKKGIENEASKYQLSIEYSHVNTPHDNFHTLEAKDKGKGEYPLYTCWYDVYTVYLHQFDYHIWLPYISTIMPHVVTLKIPSYVVSIMEEVAKVAQFRKMTLRDKMRFFEDVPTKLIQDIDKAIHTVGSKQGEKSLAFIKTSRTSGKNEREIRPVSDPYDLLHYLTETSVHYKDYSKYRQMGHDLHIIVLPWLAELDNKREFRVIVEGLRVRGISQQQWYADLHLDPTEVPTICQNIIDYYENEIKPLLILYPNVVMDMWLDNDNKPHLIECNPGQKWASSGSSLFHWINDADILLHSERPQFRYILSRK